MKFDVPNLARGWLSVAQASANDKDLPTLHRTVAMEVFPNLVQLVGPDEDVTGPRPVVEGAVTDDRVTHWDRLEAAWDHVAAQAANDPEAGALDTAAIFELPPGRTATRFEVALVVAS